MNWDCGIKEEASSPTVTTRRVSQRERFPLVLLMQLEGAVSITDANVCDPQMPN